MAYISKNKRAEIRMKFDGKCAYSGTPLEDDWQVEHIEPLCRWNGYAKMENHNDDNMVPVQAIINHYKHSLDLETFRTWFLAGLHERLGKLPKNPRTDKSKKKKAYLWKVASYFGITEATPFSGKFYFETVQNPVTP